MKKFFLTIFIIVLIVIIISPYRIVLFRLLPMVIFSPLVWVILIILFFVTKRARS